MAIKELIARGIGFSPGSTAFIPTHGLSPAVVAPPTHPGEEFTVPESRMHFTLPESRMHFTTPETRMHWTMEE